MRGLMAALGAVLVCGATALAGLVPADAKEVKEFEIGQWVGFVFTDDSTGQFSDCTIWAENGAGLYVGISVNKAWSLELYLNSKAWNLPLNQSYPISYWIDRNSIHRGKAATYSEKYVKIEVDGDQGVFDELRAGSQLTFRTQSDDYVFGLNGSSAALNRVLDCVDRYTKQVSTNPFGDGGDQQGGGQNTQPFGDGQEQSGGNGGGNNEGGQQQSGGNQQSSANALRLDRLTLSTDDVRQFLVDVTGAKPSMITVEPKSFSSGKPYHYFSTPIGAGQFWQERLDNDTLPNVLLSYLSGYKGECDGSFEQSVTDVVQGSGGQAVSGVASCSSSSYQDGGPEVLTYAITASGNIISIYATYVGGNAAKAKTDSLGRLIARRQEADIK